MRKTGYICFLFALFTSWLLCAQETVNKKKYIEFNGYLKDLQSTIFIGKIDSNFSSSLLHNRLNFKINFKTNLTARLEIRNRIFFGEQIKMTPDFGDKINQNTNIYKLSHLWYNEKSLVIHSVIDRILLRYTFRKWDFQIGRQRINWGVNNVWNPNDIFNAYNFLDFDYEERPGTDAIRIQKFFKRNTFIDFAYKPGKSNSDQTIGMLVGFNKRKYDFQFLSGIYLSDYFLGTGWAGSIGQTGFKGEMTFFQTIIGSPPKSNSFSFSTMADRTFKNEWYASLGFLYNSSPTNLLLANGNQISSNFSAKQLYPFQYNFYATLLKSISPITSLNFSFVYSTEKNTLVLFPSFSWNVASNFDLSITAQSFFTEQSDGYKNRFSTFFIRGKYSW